MYQRLAQPHLDELLAEFPAVVLLGPRQAGKTTLALAQQAQRAGALYLDLELPSAQRQMDDAEAFLLAQRNRLVILDEVQRLPGLFAVLRGVIDQRRRTGEAAGQFLLLGSATGVLLQQASESLAGRVAQLELTPFQGREVFPFADAPADLASLWVRGGFPLAWLAQDDAASLRWREAFIATYLERDIPALGPRIPAATLRRLWTMLAHNQGGLLNQSQLAAALAVSGQTVARYIDLLCDLMLVRRLPAWHGNVGKRLVRAPRVYVRDSGITHALLEIGTYDQLIGNPIVGPSFEGHVIEALIGAAGDHARPYFFRTSNGAEIDLLFEKAGSPHIAVEVKLTSAPAVPRGFHQACDDLAIGHRILVHGGTGGSWPMPNGVHACSLIQAIESIKTLTADPFGGVY